MLHDIFPSWLDVSRWGIGAVPKMHQVKWEKVYDSLVCASQVMKSSAEDWRLTLCSLVLPCGKAVGVSLHPRWQIYHAGAVSRTSVSGLPRGCSRRWALTDLCLCAWDRQRGENGCLYLVGPSRLEWPCIQSGVRTAKISGVFDCASYTSSDLRAIMRFIWGMEKAELAANSLWLPNALADQVFTFNMIDRCKNEFPRNSLPLKSATSILIDSRKHVFPKPTSFLCFLKAKGTAVTVFLFLFPTMSDLRLQTGIQPDKLCQLFVN